MINFLKKNFPKIQYVLPKLFISYLFGLLAECRVTWIKNLFISMFVKYYKVDLSDALYQDINSYDSFNSFFTRSVKKNNFFPNILFGGLLSPVNGTISQIGEIDDGCIIQAKGHSYRVHELLGGDTNIVNYFLKDSRFMTIYLSPRDYHRVHMPLGGKLKKIIYIPGKFFSVNKESCDCIPSLFSRNERVVCIFDTDYGPIAVVFVGAMIVGSIQISSVKFSVPFTFKRRVKTLSFSEDDSKKVYLRKGDELGRFRLGSTVILLTNSVDLKWRRDLKIDTSISLWEEIGL